MKLCTISFNRTKGKEKLKPKKNWMNLFETDNAWKRHWNFTRSDVEESENFRLPSKWTLLLLILHVDVMICIFILLIRMHTSLIFRFYLFIYLLLCSLTTLLVLAIHRLNQTKTTLRTTVRVENWFSDSFLYVHECLHSLHFSLLSDHLTSNEFHEFPSLAIELYTIHEFLWKGRLPQKETRVT
jgi:hypothetical protein